MLTLTAHMIKQKIPPWYIFHASQTADTREVYNETKTKRQNIVKQWQILKETTEIESLEVNCIEQIFVGLYQRVIVSFLSDVKISLRIICVSPHVSVGTTVADFTILVSTDLYLCDLKKVCAVRSKPQR
jgi:4-diphosphocytidyl-2C-methyl-D-erythritol kinase